jgi:putative transposase
MEYLCIIKAMPYRKTPIVTGEIYHIFNRSVASQPIFLDKWDYRRALEVMQFYRFQNPGIRYSYYNRLQTDLKTSFWNDLIKHGKKQVELLAFCFMFNHFHFLLKELEENGIKTFISNFQNSYAKYFNTKTERKGAVFLSMFKGVRIATEEQLIHVNRYIHLNPLTSYIIKYASELETYQWSSYIDYLGIRNEGIVDKELIMGLLKTTQKFKNFTLDQKDYQRELEKIKHLTYN